MDAKVFSRTQTSSFVPNEPQKNEQKTYQSKLQILTLQSNMCTCLWVEYCCECNKPDCPHKKPSHPHYHVQDKLFQIDHKAWRYCPAFIQAIDSAKQEIQAAIPKKTNTRSRQDNKSAVIRPSRCFKDSTDPRHDGRLPLCEDIRYSAWRIAKNCDYCRDYWIGRSMDNAI